MSSNDLEAEGTVSPEQIAVDHIMHVMLHALTEEKLSEKLEGAASQQEVYDILCQLDYFELSFAEFQIGIEALRQ